MELLYSVFFPRTASVRQGLDRSFWSLCKFNPSKSRTDFCNQSQSRMNFFEPATEISELCYRELANMTDYWDELNIPSASWTATRSHDRVTYSSLRSFWLHSPVSHYILYTVSEYRHTQSEVLPGISLRSPPISLADHSNQAKHDPFNQTIFKIWPFPSFSFTPTGSTMFYRLPEWSLYKASSIKMASCSTLALAHL